MPFLAWNAVGHPRSLLVVWNLQPVTGNFFQFPDREKNGEFMGFDWYFIGISQTGKMLPKPILGLKKTIISPKMG